jgi:hypothetical protein
LGEIVTETAESLIAYCREGKRICQMPHHWTMLWEMLPARRLVGGVWEPSLPLILAAWDETPAMFKMLRLAEHIQWAETHGALDAVAAFLQSLPEADWHHTGE